MGKRLLSSPKKRSPQKNLAHRKPGSSKCTPKNLKATGTVSVADFFSKQRDKNPTTSYGEGSREMIDISDSPKKCVQDVTTSSMESPYFSPSKNENLKMLSLRKVHTVPSRKILTKLSLREKHQSEPNEITPEIKLSNEVGAGKSAVQNEERQVTDTDFNRTKSVTKHKKSRLLLGKRKRNGLASNPQSSEQATNEERRTDEKGSTKKQKLESSGKSGISLTPL